MRGRDDRPCGIVLYCLYSGNSIVILVLLWSSSSNYEVLSIFRSNVRRVVLLGVNKRKMKVLGEREQFQ